MNNSSKRATVYFDPDLHKALLLKSAETERSVSDLVNEAVRLSLQEDRDDVGAFADRVREGETPFETVARDLKRRGKI